jgi:hypothetical protein
MPGSTAVRRGCQCASVDLGPGNGIVCVYELDHWPGASKLFFISLLFGHGLLKGQAGISAAIDLVMTLLFAVYLFASKRGSPR